ncbi:fimbrial biogenesis outer membrane usher protein [Scandinavium sp. H11S7]|uniref:Fimbrial biogenesis outer membrane usher protein n=1 Tax=Scandinavium hiltneri TaxID=2926519 RepID=A0ABT2E3X9_9ENTR|nr:fimbria/pilus outer membrane usher protein [Scandinavium hiltneri]MCS2162482.1 fimbrial biogenesis outer membrane usher protein [Scandinavium hiltneri]
MKKWNTNNAGYLFHLMTSISLMACSFDGRAAENATLENDGKKSDLQVSLPEGEASKLVESEYEFSPGFLLGNIDVSRYEKGNPVIPGEYVIDITVNAGEASSSENRSFHLAVQFKDQTGEGNGTPCFTPILLKKLGIKTEDWLDDYRQQALTANPDLNESEVDNTLCLPVQKIMPGFHWNFNNNSQKLFLAVPQAFLKPDNNDYIDPELWDEGITAGLLKYDMNFYSAETEYDDLSSNAWLGLQSGINLGAWRFRYTGNVNWDDEQGTDVNDGVFYVDRDIPALNSTLRLGQSYSDGQLFDSFSVRGFTLNTNERMLPLSQQGFAPTVNGVAETNARVTLRQGNNIVYQTTVSPGPFEINTVRSVYSGQDIEVEIRESNGTVKTFRIPYTTSSDLLRPGISHYSLTVGEFGDDNSGLSKDPLVGQLTWQYGLSNTLTVYTGLQGGENYWASLIGAGINTDIGAFTLDMTHSDLSSTEDTEGDTGESWKVSYNKLLEETDTNFQLAAYRYSTKGYYSLDDAMNYLYDDHISSTSQLNRLKNKFQININQNLSDDYGSLYVSGSIQDYWNRSGDSDLQYQIGYSNSIKDINYSISVSRYYRSEEDGYDNGNDTQFYLSFSIPFGRNTAQEEKPIFDMANISYSQDSDNNSNTNASLTGSTTTKPDDTWDANYGVNISYNKLADSDPANIYSVGGYSTFNTQFTQLGLSASMDNDHNRQGSVTMSGGVVAHRGGITLAPDLNISSPIALVEAEGATGAVVDRGNHARIDRWGYGVTSALTPYRNNTIEINPMQMEADTLLESTSQNVVPYDGAVTLVKFNTDSRTSRYFYVTRPGQDNFIPLGADVFNEQNQLVGNAGQNGLLTTRGTEPQGVLTVRWGKDSGQQCTVTYNQNNTVESFDGISVIRGLQCR